VASAARKASLRLRRASDVGVEERQAAPPDGQGGELIGEGAQRRLELGELAAVASVEEHLRREELRRPVDVVVPVEVARRLRGARRRVELAAGEGPERVEDEQVPLVDGQLRRSGEAAKRFYGRGVAGPVAALQ
jgi:hypothetical protein